MVTRILALHHTKDQMTHLSQATCAGSEENVSVLAQSNLGHIMVCLCDCEGLCGGTVPLVNLRQAIIDYVGGHGGEGKLGVVLFYKDEDGNCAYLTDSSPKAPDPR